MTYSGYTREHTGELILIVEDSPTQAEQLRYILEKHRYRVSIAGSGNAALALIGEVKPALIISDIIMPEMDGYELCRRIKAIDDCRDIPVILLTSLSDPQDVIRGLACGADNFFTKPYDEEYLLSRVMHILENRYQLRENTPLPGLDISFACQRYVITSDRRQILDLLLSTYEAAIRKNNELVRAQDELKKLNEQLQGANQELEAFGYTVSHDLRGPLNNIHGSCQVIEQIYADTFDEQCRQFFRYISEATIKMDRLIGTILKFSLLTRQELQREKVDLSDMARAILVEPRFNEPQRRVTFHIADGIIANGDMQLLRIVLENLLGNAWKYTGTKEHAVIEFGMLECGGNPAYFVRDNGSGFDMACAGMLFAPFQRLHAADEFEGFGIGLSTVQRIVQRHGGRVWAEGEPGRGAVFYFTLGLE
ncbi:MAG: response regulator [Deltaproteobacteria bacterium]|nr:response regulator [Deltaproteobacteria bacterium]